MQLAKLESRIDELVYELRQFNGHRTVWLSESGELVHSEPEDMLEVRGFAYVSTLWRPTREELTNAVSGFDGGTVAGPAIAPGGPVAGPPARPSRVVGFVPATSFSEAPSALLESSLAPAL